jgi:hypothetical protein
MNSSWALVELRHNPTWNEIPTPTISGVTKRSSRERLDPELSVGQLARAGDSSLNIEFQAFSAYGRLKPGSEFVIVRHFALKMTFLRSYIPSRVNFRAVSSDVGITLAAFRIQWVSI